MGYLTAEYTKSDNFERQWKNQHIWFVYKLFNVAQYSLNAEGSSRLSSRVAVPSPWGKTGRRECLRRAGTNRVMWRQSNLSKLCKQIIFSAKERLYSCPHADKFVNLPFSFWSLNLFLCFTLVYEGHFMLCYKEKLELSDRACYGKLLRGHKSAWVPLFISACRFVELDTSIICHVLVHCFGSFLLQDIF